MSDQPPVAAPSASSDRLSLILTTALLTAIVLLVCLMPKAENDLFFELRTGMDILRTGHLPRVDAYSWTNAGTRWDVPEWLAFVLYSLAFKAARFFGTWLLMALLTVGAVLTVWFWLAPRVGRVWAFLLANLTLIAMNPCIQERPYAFTYLLLAVSLIILTRWREEIGVEKAGGAWGGLLWLPAICVLWTNMHQGVLVLVCLLMAYAVADAVAWLRLREQNETNASSYGRSAGQMLAIAFACAVAVMASPYGWRVYWNVFITMRDRNLMSNVTEWNSVAVLPFVQLQPLILITALTCGALYFSRRPGAADAFVLLCLFGESLLHARNIALFAIGVATVAAPHFESCVQGLRGRVRLASSALSITLLLSFGALIYAATVGLVVAASLGKVLAPTGNMLDRIGEGVARVPTYPESACAFMDRENFPTNLRMLNNFEIGGYLMWRRPSQPVFVDGRLDVYVGPIFDNMLVIARPSNPQWASVTQSYDFNCVVAMGLNEAKPFLADPKWALVYLDPDWTLVYPDRRHRPKHTRCRVFLRRNAALAPLIARCLKDRPIAG